MSDKIFGYDDYKIIKETVEGLLSRGYTLEMIYTVIEQNFERGERNEHNDDVSENNR